MNVPTDIHEPTAEFRSHLEWQIETAMRRESRLAEPVTSGGFSRWRGLATAALVVAALAVGGAAGMASEHLQDVRARDQLLVTAAAEEQLARTRLELARAEYQEVRRRVEVGAAGRESLAVAERRVRAMEAAVKRLQLEIEETKATSAPPRDDLSSPMVGQRDFVKDRLVLDLQAAEQDLAAAEQAVVRAKERVSVGVQPQSSLIQAEAEMALARDRMHLIRIRIEARQRFLQEQVSTEQLVVSLRQMEMTIELSRAQREIVSAQQQLEAVRKLFQTGLVSTLEVKRSEVELLEAEARLKSIQRQLQSIKKE